MTKLTCDCCGNIIHDTSSRRYLSISFGDVFKSWESRRLDICIGCLKRKEVTQKGVDEMLIELLEILNKRG